MIKVRCPNCHCVAKASESPQSRVVACPKCKQAMRIPGSIVEAELVQPQDTGLSIQLRQRPNWQDEAPERVETAPAPNDPPHAEKPYYLHLREDGTIAVKWTSEAEARLIKQQADAMKRDLKLRVSANIAQKRMVTANYKAARAGTGPAIRSTKGLSGVIRIIQLGAKARIQSMYEPELHRLAQERLWLDRCILNLSHLDLQIARWLSGHSS